MQHVFLFVRLSARSSADIYCICTSQVMWILQCLLLYLLTLLAWLTWDICLFYFIIFVIVIVFIFISLDNLTNLQDFHNFSFIIVMIFFYFVPTTFYLTKSITRIYPDIYVHLYKYGIAVFDKLTHLQRRQ